MRDDPTQDDASAEFERTGRLPDDGTDNEPWQPPPSSAEETREQIARSRTQVEGLMERNRRAEAEQVRAKGPPEPLYNMSIADRQSWIRGAGYSEEQVADYEYFVTWVGIHRRNIKICVGFLAAGIIAIIFLAANDVPWWAYILPGLVAAYGAIGLPLEIFSSAMREYIKDRWERGEYKKTLDTLQKICAVGGSILFAWAVGGWDNFAFQSIFDTRRWSNSFWRLSFFIEGAIIASTIFSLCVSWEKEKWLSLRRSLALGSVAFIFIVLIMPLIGTGFFLQFVHGIANQDLRAIVLALFCLILSFPLGMAFGRMGYLLIAEPDDNRPIDFAALATQAWQFVIKPRSKAVDAAKSGEPPPQPAAQPNQSTYQPQQINIEFKQRRQWRMPSLPGADLFKPQAWAGRFMALLWLSYTQVQAWTHYDLIQNNQWVGFPTDDRAPVFYLAVAVMAVSFVMFLVCRRRINPHDLRNLRLIAFALLQAAVGFVLLTQYQSLHLPPETDLVASYLIIAGLTRVLLLLRNPVKATGWRRFI